MADETGGHVVARRIGIVNEKGGSCKTTLAVHLGAYLAGEKGKRVLLIDCDPQGHLGKTLGYDVNAYSRTTLEMLLDEERDPALFVRRTRFKGLEVVLSNKSIAIFPTVTAADPQRHLRLRRAMDRLPGYDFIVIDSPASFGTLMLSIFAAAEELVVPVNASFLALDGCAELTRTLATLPSSPGISAPDLRLIVPTLYRPTRMANAVLERLRAHFPGRVFPEPLRYDVKVEEAQSYGRTVWEYAPRSRAGAMLADLGQHLLTMGAPPGRAPMAEGARAPEADEETVATNFRREA